MVHRANYQTESVPNGSLPRKFGGPNVEFGNPAGKTIPGFFERTTVVQSERPRARRYPFVASIEMTDVESEAQVNEQTCDLSLFGCGVTRKEPLPVGTRTRIRIVHNGASFVALGKVAHAGHGTRMGVVFTKIEPQQQLILENWIAETREAKRTKKVRV